MAGLSKIIESNETKKQFVHFFDGNNQETTTENAIQKSEIENEIEGERNQLYLFKNYVVEVKENKEATRTQILIHNFADNITVFWNPPPKGFIMSVEILETPDQG